MKYRVHILERLIHVYDVEAESMEEVEEMVGDMPTEAFVSTQCLEYGIDRIEALTTA